MSLRPEVLVRRTLLGLPVTEWASGMRKGTVDLRGKVVPGALRVGGWPLRLDGGTLHLRADFLGGAVPTLVRLDVETAFSVEVEGSPVAGRRLTLRDQRIEVDGVEIPRGADRVGSGRLLASVVKRLSDAAVSARAEPDGDIVLRLGGGVEVRVSEGVLLTIDAAARGPADDLRLCRPVELGFGGEGIRLHHGRLEWLSRLASVHVARATLHPDGSVDLEGGGRGRFDVAVRGGLHTASASLSALVRRSPGVRRFLRVGDSWS